VPSRGYGRRPCRAKGCKRNQLIHLSKPDLTFPQASTSKRPRSPLRIPAKGHDSVALLCICRYLILGLLSGLLSSATNMAVPALVGRALDRTVKAGGEQEREVRGTRPRFWTLCSGRAKQVPSP
jgi:hypothetical protein